MSIFATPVIIYPDQDPEEFELECARMIARAEVLKAWQSGEITTRTLMDAFDELGVDIIQASTDWADGVHYI